QKIDSNSAVLQSCLRASEERVPLLPLLINLHPGTRHDGGKTLQPVTLHKNQKVEVRCGPRLAPQRQRPRADDRVTHSSAPQAIHHMRQGCGQIIVGNSVPAPSSIGPTIALPQRTTAPATAAFRSPAAPRSPADERRGSSPQATEARSP